MNPDSLKALIRDSISAGRVLNDTISQLLSDRTAIGVDSVTFVETDDIEETDSIDDDREIVTRINREKVDIDNSVTFSAKDSVILLGNKLAYLFGDGEVEYGNFKLNADEIKMVMDSTTVYANGRLDSVGELQGKPVFQDGGDTYESKTMAYNFKNQRGYITDIITEQGEGYLTGGRAKKMADGSFFSEDAIYTTCDEHDHPHFYIKLTKGKIRPGKDVVSGAAYMVVADVPLPIALPFGYFPFSKEYSSGIIFPTFGDDYNRGFYARNGGYYFAFSDYVDLAVTG
ncbi:MAG: LPS-assembly protein LptD, partial [Muribaculaceae bacterium]|nr:LPS-assembly protein LptD [Muribaculaceae bacterium]